MKSILEDLEFKNRCNIVTVTNISTSIYSGLLS